MLPADVEIFRESLKSKDFLSVIDIAVDSYVENSDLKARMSEMESSGHQMYLQFTEMKDLLASREHEIKELRKQNLHLAGIYAAQTQEMYGRSSEKGSAIRNEVATDTEYTDPLSEDSSPEDPKPTDESGKESDKTTGKGKVVSFHGHSGKGRDKKDRKLDTSALPKCEFYDYDLDALNEEYGEGNWRFCFWEKYETIELQRQYTYVKVIYKPVVSYGSYHDLRREPFEGRIMPGRKTAASLLAQIFCDHAFMHLPYYRMEMDTDRFGIPISRQDMTNWKICVSEELFKPVYLYLTDLLKHCPYQQCDETKYLVIREKSHTCNYIWVHRTSEFSETEQIIIYCYDPSRSADHLLKFYEGIKEHIHLTSDAYGAYFTLENTYPEFITVCGCFMHARRRPVDSIRSVRKGLPDEMITEMPEMKMIDIIGRMYAAEEELKGLSADERLDRRNKDIAPIVDEYFEYIKSLDMESPIYNDKFKDAVTYSINQEKQLRRFLEDGHIPIDNGACERSVKPIATHRKGSMFSYSEKGADATMMIMSLVETARANNAIPYYYLKYLMEEMAKGVHYRHEYRIEDMTPWSEAYRAYEKQQRKMLPAGGAPPGNIKPHTPKKKEKIKIA